MAHYKQFKGRQLLLGGSLHCWPCHCSYAIYIHVSNHVIKYDGIPFSVS